MHRLERQAHVGATTKHFTIVLQCVDPVVPVWLEHTNRESRARSLFNALRALELAAGGPSGEMELTWYEHTTARSPSRVFAIRDDPTYGFDLPFVYALDYEHATIRDRFTYVDAIHEESALCLADPRKPQPRPRGARRR